VTTSWKVKIDSDGSQERRRGEGQARIRVWPLAPKRGGQEKLAGPKVVMENVVAQETGVPSKDKSRPERGEKKDGRA